MYSALATSRSICSQPSGRHVANVRPSFVKTGCLARTRESARAATFERAAHRASEAFDRCADYRGCLRCLGCSGSHVAQSSLALDAREQLRLVSFKTLETVSYIAEVCF